MKVRPHRIKYYVLSFYLLLVAAWQLLYSLQIMPDYLFPSPVQVARLGDTAGGKIFVLPVQSAAAALGPVLP